MSHSNCLSRIGVLLFIWPLHLFGCLDAWAQQTPPPSSEGLSPEELKLREVWRTDMAQVPLPKEGCFECSYPSREWTEVPCATAPDYPMVPKRGPRPLVVGNGDDISAQAPTGFISTAIGSFDSVTNVTSESGQIGNTGPAVANAYTLQINTDFFSTTACSGAGNPAACSGWQQFVFWNDGSTASAFIQYWLIRYNNPCPTGQSWNQFSFSGSTDIYCWKNNSGGAVAIPNQPITNLGQLSLTGTMSASGDSVRLSDGSTIYARSGDNVFGAADWQIAEFNVLGPGGNSAGGAQANFNSGADIVVRTRIFYGDEMAPNCVAQGFTGETNNLSFGPSAPTPSQPGPAVIFRESTAGGATSNCAAAATVGDTHLATFGGLFYDFQASGDFVLAKVGPDFVVQARQVSGAPTWPNASVNSAIATQMGDSKVVICLPMQLNVDGADTELADGDSVSTPDGVDIWRHDNVYFILSPSGHSVRATVHATWIDVLVGLGRCPVEVSGLLANANGDVNKIATREGAVLTNPFSFQELYHHYGESWRVAPEESLLSVCHNQDIERENPSRPFYARDLEPEVYERARAVCTQAGVEGEAFLDACTLDVAVIGDDQAAQVFVEMREPVVVAITEAEAVFRRGDGNQDGQVDISDAVATLGCLFLGQECWGCDDAHDSNDDGVRDISDAVYTLGFLFTGGDPLPAPGIDTCGEDPTTDELSICIYDVTKC